MGDSTTASAPRAARGMGRGLAAILSSSPGQAGEELRQIPVDLIVPNPRQPRRTLDEEGLQGLARSLEDRGVLQPVLVRPVPGGTFELVAGERRWRAAQLAGLQTVPALVRSRDDAASLELALIENMAREDLSPVEEARACAALVEELGLTREEVGRRVGRSRVAVSNLLRLLDLPDAALALLESGQLSEGHGRALLLAADHDTRRVLARDAVALGWSVRELEARARATLTATGSAPGRHTAPSRDGRHERLLAQAADALGSALGRDVSVRPHRRGFRIEVAVASLEELAEFAAELGAWERHR